MTVKKRITEKLFYNKYPYKISIKLNGDPYYRQKISLVAPKGEKWEKHIFFLRHGLKATPIRIQAWFNKRTSGNTRHRLNQNRNRNSYYYDFCLHDSEILKEAIKHFGNRVVQVHEPITPKHFSVLEDTKIRIKHHLYWHRFRYKVVLFGHCMSSLSRKERLEFDDYLINMFGDRYRSSLLSWSKIIYFEKEEDVILFKLSYAEMIFKFEKVMTYEEL